MSFTKDFLAEVQPVTAHSEVFQAVIWHLFVSHPKLQVTQTKRESTK